MDDRLQHLLRLALHQFLDLCRDVRRLDLDPGTRAALSKAELYAWKWLGEYRHADAAQQSRLLGRCIELDKRVRLWVEPQLPRDRQPQLKLNGNIGWMAKLRLQPLFSTNRRATWSITGVSGS